MPEGTPARLAPGSTIGILGGGQLGRMLSMAAARLGLRCHVFCPDPESPAFDVAAAQSCAAYDDVEALERFARAVDVVTYEFENIPPDALDALDRTCLVRPGRRSLEVSQDRLTEKRFVADAGARVAPHHPISMEEDLGGWDFGPGASILKTRRLGYDGKGQISVASRAGATAAFARLGSVPCVIERRIAFEREISAIVARGADGSMVAYEPGHNTHTADHILSETTVPAGISDTVAAQAIDTATSIAGALDHVGVLAVEYFVVTGESGDGLIVNEIAPRVHNSGHWTQDGASVCQFELHMRAVAGWPLIRPRRLAPCTMRNLIGADIADWPKHAADPASRLHLYGKRETRSGRKMGHVNRIASSPGGETFD